MLKAFSSQSVLLALAIYSSDYYGMFEILLGGPNAIESQS